MDKTKLKLDLSLAGIVFGLVLAIMAISNIDAGHLGLGYTLIGSSGFITTSCIQLATKYLKKYLKDG